jgi:hypothetical protein
MNLILEALRKAGMRINKSKYIFYVKEMEFLGYIVGLDEIKMDPKKIQAIQDWPVLRSVTEV